MLAPSLYNCVANIKVFLVMNGNDHSTIQVLFWKQVKITRDQSLNSSREVISSGLPKPWCSSYPISLMVGGSTYTGGIIEVCEVGPDITFMKNVKGNK